MERFIEAATVGDPIAAHVLAARLDAEGIETRLSGEALGPYRLTVGAWATTRIMVRASDFDDALLVLLAADVDTATPVEPRPPGPSAHPGRSLLWMSVALLTLAAMVIRYL
jgi:hypothetical protein